MDFYRCIYYENCLEKSEIGLIELVGDKQKSKRNYKNFRKWIGGRVSRKIRREGKIRRDEKGDYSG